MNDERIEAALQELGKHTPRAPEKTVDDMVKTVDLLERKRQQLAAKNAPAAEAEKTREREAIAKPHKDLGGMKR